MEQRGHIVQISVSGGGVPKFGMHTAEVGPLGIIGDVQRDTRVHGGPDRALCVYSLEQMLALQREGHAIYPGSIGENILTAGVDLAPLEPGALLRFGAVEAEVTGYAHPCSNIAASFRDADFTRISIKLHPGSSRLYLRILTPGTIAVGDPVTLGP